MPKKERTIRLGNTKMAAIVFVTIGLIIAGRMIYIDIRDKRRGDVYQFRTSMQEHFNALPYFSIDGNADKLRDYIAKARIRLYGDIPEERVELLRDRLFDLIWTHHAGGFDRYMRLRKTPGIDYQFNTNYFREWVSDKPELDSEEANVGNDGDPYSDGTLYAGIDSQSNPNGDNSPELGDEEDLMREEVKLLSGGTFYSNFVTQVCLDYKALQELRYWCYAGMASTNAFFGAHIFRTNSLADSRFCVDVRDFHSTNTVERFKLHGNALFHMGWKPPDPLYFTAETPQQELETTGEITLAYVYFTFKSAYHSGNAAPFMAQWHWDKAKVRWILDYICSGDDYRYPVSRYASEPHIFVTF